MNPSALRRARELRCLTLSALAKKLDVSTSILSQIESGRVKASERLIQLICQELKVTKEFLVKNPLPVGNGSLGLFRSYTSKVSHIEALAIRQKASILAELTENLAVGIDRPSVKISHSQSDRISYLAGQVRASLMYGPTEPIGNLTRRIEKIGAVVLKSDLKENAVFGYSFWLHGKVARPYILISHIQTAYRARWTLAHELGHICLGHEFSALDPKTADLQANEFASSLLIPEEAFQNDLLGGVSISAFSHLKSRYGVSIAALVRRAYDLKIIDGTRYESLLVQISRKGWRKMEPGDELAEFEEPILFRQLVDRRFGKDTDSFKIAEQTGYPEDVVFESLCGSKEYVQLNTIRKAMEGLTSTSTENEDFTLEEFAGLFSTQSELDFGN